jgi:anti-sigma B factor antagonist
MGIRACESPWNLFRGFASAVKSEAADMSDIFRRQQIGEFTVIEFITPSLMDPIVLENTAQALYKVIDEEDKRKIIMDFEKVQYLSSQAIGIVLAMHKKLNSLTNSKLILCSVGPKLMELIKLTRLDRLLTIKATQKEAVGVWQ